MSKKLSAKNFLFVPIAEGPHRQALNNLSKLADSSGSSIRLFAVVERATFWDRALNPDFVEEAQTSEHQDWTKTFARWSSASSVTGSEISIGKGAETIVERSLEPDVDCIVLSAGDDPHQRAVVDRVIRLAECPVWLLRPTRARTCRVLAAIHPEPGELDLNLEIIERATGVARETGGELTIMSAWEVYGEHTLQHSSFLRLPEKDFHEIWIGRGEMTEKSLRDVVEAIKPDIKHEVKAVHGSPVEAIHAEVKAGKINQLVIGTVGRAGLTGALLGNTAEQVIRDVRCSVLVVKAPGFVSPLRGDR